MVLSRFASIYSCILFVIPLTISKEALNTKRFNRQYDSYDLKTQNPDMLVVEAILPLGSARQSVYKLGRQSGIGWILNAKEDHNVMLILRKLINSRNERSIIVVQDAESHGNMDKYMLVIFSKSPVSCLQKFHVTDQIIQVNMNMQSLIANISINLPYDKKPYYLCIKLSNISFDISQSENQWKHQGTNEAITIQTVQLIMPVWLMYCLIFILLTVSGLFSGLNLGLMSLTPQDLDIIIAAEENSKIAKYAKQIMPVRSRGNFLLCTILLGNVLVNATATVMIEEIIDGIYAIIGSTIGIVIFGEIIPQALCSRHGLLVGAKTLILTKIFMVLTFPIAYPLSKLLDYALGPDVGSSYTRRQILELVKRTTKDIEQHEMAIVAGALALKTKIVEDLMTPLIDVFMIDGNREVNSNLMIEIYKQGFTRIPVYSSNRQNVTGLINIRDFAFIDLDGNMTLSNVCAYFNHPVGRVAYDANIFDLFEEFKKGNYHIALVEHQIQIGVPPILTGIITLEDIIEEIIQSQIYDEWDYISDEASNNKRTKTRAPDFSVFLRPAQETDHIISSQQKIALFQFLSAAVAPFQSKYISSTVLRKLINNDAVVVDYRHDNSQFEHENERCNNAHHARISTATNTYEDTYLYKYGKLSDFFVLIISGKATLETGKEKIASVVGPFSYFGTSALCHENEDIQLITRSSNFKPRSILPDFSLKLVQDTVYLRVTRTVWIAAVRASAFEKQQSRLTTVDCSRTVNDFLAEELNRAIETTSNDEPVPFSQCSALVDEYIPTSSLTPNTTVVSISEDNLEIHQTQFNNSVRSPSFPPYNHMKNVQRKHTSGDLITIRNSPDKKDDELVHLLQKNSQIVDEE